MKPMSFFFIEYYTVYVIEKEMAVHFSVPAWRIPETAEPGGLPSMRSHRVGHNWSNLAAAAGYRSHLLMWMKRSYIAFEHIFIKFPDSISWCEKNYTLFPDRDTGDWGRQNNGFPKDAHGHIHKTCGYVAFHGIGELRLLISWPETVDSSLDYP